MKNMLKRISAAVQLVLLAPVKLPGKALNVIKYIALGLGVLETVVGGSSDKVDKVGRGDKVDRVDRGDKVDKVGKVDRDELAEGES